MGKISAFIITLNEENKILSALESVAFCDEIIVVDSGSTDDTVTLCENFGARVIKHNWEGYAKQKQFAMMQCQYDWCLNIDADELVSVELRQSILRALSLATDIVAYEIVGRNQFLGSMVPVSMRPEYHVRLFRKSKVSYDSEKLVHESVAVSGKKTRLTGHINHMAKESIAIFQKDLDKYSTLRAVEKQRCSKRPSLLKLFFIFPLTFIKKYFIQRAIFFGARGLILSIMESYYAFLKEAKLWELNIEN